MKSLRKNMSSENKMRTKLFSISSTFYFRDRRQKRLQGKKLRELLKRVGRGWECKSGTSMYQ